MPKRLVIFVEGKGDIAAVPVLVNRVIKKIGAYDAFFVDDDPFRVRSVATLVKDACFDLHRWLNAAGRTRKNLGAVLITLDGDPTRVPPSWSPYLDRFGSSNFCAYKVAAMLGEESRAVRAGELYSLATVFAIQEFEAWLLGGIESLRGKLLAEGRGKVPDRASCPEIDLESVRDAKGLLKSVVKGYDQSLDQAVLAGEIDLDAVFERCRSFQRFVSALQQLADAVRINRHVVTPSIPFG